MAVHALEVSGAKEESKSANQLKDREVELRKVSGLQGECQTTPQSPGKITLRTPSLNCTPYSCSQWNGPAFSWTIGQQMTVVRHLSHEVQIRESASSVHARKHSHRTGCTSAKKNKRGPTKVMMIHPCSIPSWRKKVLKQDYSFLQLSPKVAQLEASELEIPDLFPMEHLSILGTNF